MPRDLRTQAIVLKRTNFAEADRILHLLTPEGKINLIAKGVRKEKSRLAGGIELFTLADVTIHCGRGDLAILTSAKMLKFYGKIIADMSRLELASFCMKKISVATEHADSPDFFNILEQTLAMLDQGTSPLLAEVWFLLNLARVTGEEINLIYDINNEKLSPEKRYIWDDVATSLKVNPSGDISSREIKLARLILGHSLAWVAKIEQVENSLPQLLKIAKTFS